MPDQNFVSHYSELPANPSDERYGTRTPLSRRLGLERIGVHFDRIEPGQQTTRLHAERFEEECLFVLTGNAICVIDDVEHEAGPGAFAAYAPGTGIKHTVVNRSDAPVDLLVVGERRDHGGIAIAGLLRLWTETDADKRSEIAARIFADGVRYELPAGGQEVSGADAIAGLEALRLDEPANVVTQAIGYREGLFEWRAGPVFGVCALDLEPSFTHMIHGVRDVRLFPLSGRDAAA